MKKIMIASPAYDGKVHVPFAISLSETVLLMAMNQNQVFYNITTSGSLLVAERNKILKNFIDSDCTHILMVDSDLGWPAQAVLALINHDVDFVAGVYPARGPNKEFMFRAKLNPDNSIVKSEKNLLGMEYIPAGFMLLKREAVQKMIDKFPELYFMPKDPKMSHANGWCLFNTEVNDGEFWGEDYVFCRKAREAGLDIWVDPMIEFDHAGTRGMLMNCLSNKPEENKNGM